MQPLRLALLGAFAFPAPLGSQRFAAEQARALVAAGATVELFTYGARASRRGLGPGKLAADQALAARLTAAQRVRPFAAVLAHNAEAALVALSVRRRTGLPVIYVAHTLWAEEAETWLPRLPGLPRLAQRAGRRLDLALSRSADAVLVLTSAARNALAPAARGPVACIPPGHSPEPPPAPAEIAAACARHGLAFDGFALYAGNLDRYQDLDVLDAAAAETPGTPVVAVTHDARAARFRRLRVIRVDSVAEARLLTHGAGVALLPRRRGGGFSIKLLHYMEAQRAIVARAGLAASLVQGESAWLLQDDAAPADFAAALRSLATDAALRTQLGAGAQRALAAQHAWPQLAERTLALLRSAIELPASR